MLCLLCQVYRNNIRRKGHIRRFHPGKQNVGPDMSVGRGEGAVRYAAKCQFCHREYQTKAKLIQHHRKYHLAPAAATPTSQTAASSSPTVTLSPSSLSQHTNTETLEQKYDLSNETKNISLNPKSETVEYVQYIESCNSTPGISYPNVINVAGDILNRAMDGICPDISSVQLPSTSNSIVFTTSDSAGPATDTVENIKYGNYSLSFGNVIEGISGNHRDSAGNIIHTTADGQQHIITIKPPNELLTFAVVSTDGTQGNPGQIFQTVIPAIGGSLNTVSSEETLLRAIPMTQNSGGGGGVACEVRYATTDDAGCPVPQTQSCLVTNDDYEAGTIFRLSQ